MCGACCRRVTAVDPEWPTRGDGACYFLQADNSCGIYETRPLLCRIDEGQPAGMTREEWHRLNAEACAEMQREADAHG